MKLLLAFLLTILSVPSVSMSEWIEDAFAKGKNPPFSFEYGGVLSSRTIAGWKHSISSEPVQEEGVVKYTVTYFDPRTRLEVECDITGYEDFNAVDWVLHFANRSSKNSPVLSRVKALDFSAVSSSDGPFVTLRLQGSLAWKEDFKPILDTLAAGESHSYSPRNGRSSDWDVCPFFNTLFPDGRGIVTSVGWTGTWFEEMACKGRTLTIGAGMQEMELYLLPGESIRTPLVSMLFWDGGEFMTGCNRFRRFMLAHNMRHTNGQTSGVPLLATISSADLAPCTERVCLTSELAVTHIHRFEFYGIHPGTYWLDAGWYTRDALHDRTRNWENTAGTWRPDPARFPDGFRPIADAAHAQGSKLMVWFEPERVCKGSQVYEEHPEWLLWSASDSNQALFNLGNPEALEWMCSYIGDFIAESGIDWYRQDNCFRSLRPYWDENDGPGRRGITEIRHIEGLYAFWDYLLERFPDMLIDNCASGGRRFDIEMFRRSVPLWRTDFSSKSPVEKEAGRQGHTYGLNFFLPVHGTNIKRLDSYSFYSGLAAADVFGVPLMNNREAQLDQMLDRISLLKELQPYFYEDYYPLTGICNCTGESKWLAYQLHRPSDGSGLVIAFRHSLNDSQTCRVCLQGIDPSLTYFILDQDTQEMTLHRGAELSDLTLRCSEAPGAILLRYGPAQP